MSAMTKSPTAEASRTLATLARPKPALLILGLIVLAAFPLVFTNSLVVTIGIYCLIYVVAASGWNVFTGFTGYFSLGHAVFFGTGAYTVALLSTHLNMAGGWAVFALLPLAGLIAAAISLPLGWIGLRVRRHAFVVITIAFFFIFEYLAYNLPFTQGSAGIVLPAPGFSPTEFDNAFYYISAIVAVIAVASAWAIRKSRFGLQLFAVRDDEDRARSLGVRVTQVKLASFMFSAFFVGVAGGIWAYFLGQIFPQYAFNPAYDLTVALMAFVGGLGTVGGVVFGAIVLEILQRSLILFVPITDLYLIIYGVIFLLVVLFMPEGVVRPVARWWDRARRRFSAGATPSGPVVVAAAGAEDSVIEPEAASAGAAASARQMPSVSQHGAVT